MKKNITIIILSVIIAFLIYKTMEPTVVTERQMDLKNRYSQTNLSKNIKNRTTEKYTKNYNYDDENNYDNEYYDDYNTAQHEISEEQDNFLDRKVINVEDLNKPIRFRKEHPKYEFEEDVDQIKKDKTYYPESENNIETNMVKSKKNEPSKFASNLQTCKPYKETMDAEYLGVKINYAIEILGWENNKCILNFKSQMTGIGDTFSKTYDIDPEDVAVNSFTPNIRCEFTKAQLLYMGDSALQEEERNNGANNNMLKNPNDIVFPEFQNMTIEDAKLLHVIFGNKACKIQNLEELKNMLNESINTLY